MQDTAQLFLFLKYFAVSKYFISFISIVHAVDAFILTLRNTFNAVPPVKLPSRKVATNLLSGYAGVITNEGTS